MSASKPVLFVHTGTHKTGTKAIQDRLRFKEPELKEEGITVVPFPRGVFPMMNQTEISEELIGSLRIGVESAANTRSGAVNVLSWEGFSGARKLGYRNIGAVAHMMKAALTAFDVRIVVFLRRQDDFVESLYVQEIHQGASFAFDEFVAGLGEMPFDYEKFLGAYADSFGQGNLIVRRYGKDYLSGESGLFVEFGAILGSARFPEGEEARTPNRGYSREALEVARLLNPELSERERKRLRKVLQTMSGKIPFDNFTFWSGTERTNFYERYRESNARVAEKFFPEVSGDLFREPVIESCDPAEPLSSDEVLKKVVNSFLEWDRMNEESRTPKSKGWLSRIRRRLASKSQ